jgi:hypothetical protein
MPQYLAGVDVGTTGARCMIFDLGGNPVAGHYCDYGATILGRAGSSRMRVADHSHDGSLPPSDWFVGHRSAADRLDRFLGPAFDRLPRRRRRQPGPSPVFLAGRAHGRSGGPIAPRDLGRRILRSQRVAAGHDVDHHQAAVDARARARFVGQDGARRPEPGSGAAGLRRRRLLHRPVLRRLLRRVGCASGHLEPVRCYRSWGWSPRSSAAPRCRARRSERSVRPSPTRRVSPPVRRCASEPGIKTAACWAWGPCILVWRPSRWARPAWRSWRPNGRWRASAG